MLKVSQILFSVQCSNKSKKHISNKKRNSGVYENIRNILIEPKKKYILLGILSWTHYCLLLKVEQERAREF